MRDCFKEGEVRLTLYGNKSEWLYVMRQIKPDVTEEEFEAAWEAWHEQSVFRIDGGSARIALARRC